MRDEKYISHLAFSIYLLICLLHYENIVADG